MMTSTNSKQTRRTIATEKQNEKPKERAPVAMEDLMAIGNIMANALGGMVEDNKRSREMEKAENEKRIEVLADRLEALQVAQLKNFETQKNSFTKVCWQSW